MTDTRTADGLPPIIDLDNMELCQHHDGSWSLRKKQGDDRVHLRYLNDFEAKLARVLFARTRKL